MLHLGGSALLQESDVGDVRLTDDLRDALREWVTVADVVLARAFAGAFGLLWIPANLLVTAGTAPSLWMAREVQFWRWPALGAAAGVVVTWVVMLLGLLG